MEEWFIAIGSKHCVVAVLRSRRYITAAIGNGLKPDGGRPKPQP